MKDDWESQHAWQPTLEESYSEVFATNCAKYPHYFDAVQDYFGELENEFPTLASDPLNHHCTHCFTALDEDFFGPK